MPLHYFISFLYVFILASAIVGAIALVIAGLVLRKSKKKLSKILLITGGGCLSIVVFFWLISILGSILSGVLSV